MAAGDDILAKYGIKSGGSSRNVSDSYEAGDDILAKYGISSKKKKKKPSTADVQGLIELAQQQGLGQQALNIAKTTRRGIGGAFGKLGDILSRVNYASANIAREVTDTKQSSLLDVLRAGGRGLAGREKTTYGGLLKERGVGELGRINTPLGPITGRGALGFIGDVALDPTTYFGPGAVKAAIGGVKKAGAITKVTPKLAQLSSPIREALGKAFVYGSGVSPELPENISKILNRMRTAKSGIVEGNIARTGRLGRQEEGKLFQALTETRLGEFGARKGSQEIIEGSFKQKALTRAKQLGASDETIATLKHQLERNTKFAKTAGVKNPYEVYYPFIEADNLKKIEQSTSALKKGSQGYLKQFEAKLKPEDIIKSVPEAYSRREYQIVRDKITGDSLKFIAKKYGKQFATEEEAVKAGYRALKEKGQFGKVVGYLKEKDLNFVNNYLNPEMATLDKLAKASKFDSFNRIWKTAVTKYFPAFHARNFGSGVLQNYEVIGATAFNPKIHSASRNVLRTLAGREGGRAVTIGKKTYKTSQLAKEFSNTFGKGDWRHIADIGDMIFEGQRMVRVPSKVTELLRKADYGAFLGEFVETQQKMVAYLGSLKQGKSIKEALKLAEKAGFDYSKITQFESKVLRRLIPFYTFTRKNLELQARTLLEKPNRIANQFKAFRAIGEQPTEEELAGLPDYVKQGFVTKTGRTDPYGRQIFTTAGGTALEQALQQISGNAGLRIASQTNPLLKGLIEYSTGLDTFRSSGGRNVETKDVKKADKYAKFPEFFKKWLKMKPVERKRYANGVPVGTYTGYDADPTRLQIMNLLPSSRFISTFSAILDPTKNKKQILTDLLTGIKEYAADPEEQKFWNEKDTKEALEDLLIKAGVIKRFSTTYIPKNR